MSQQNQEPMLDVARGDIGLSRHLRKSLQVISEKTNDKEFKKLADDIVNGKKSLREASKSETFSRVLDSHTNKALSEFSAMTDDEREELARVGERELATLGSNISIREQRDQETTEEDDEVDYSETTWLR